MIYWSRTSSTNTELSEDDYAFWEAPDYGRQPADVSDTGEFDKEADVDEREETGGIENIYACGAEPHRCPEEQEGAAVAWRRTPRQRSPPVKQKDPAKLAGSGAVG